MQQLGERWYNAAKNNLDTTGRMNLYKETDDVVEFIGRRLKEAGKGQIKEVNNLCMAIIEGFNKPDESKKLTMWIAENTSIKEGRQMELTGAYPVLHRLFETIAKIQEKPVDPANIDHDALQSISSSKKGLPESTKDLEHIYFSQLSTNDLLAMCATSKESKAFILPHLIDRINNQELILSDLGIRTVEEAIKFFDKSCSRLRILNLRDFAGINDQNIENISESFPQVTSLFLKNALITSAATSSFAKMTSIKNLEFSGCQEIDDFSFLENYSKLTNLSLSGCEQINDFSFLEKCPSIKSLDLSNSSITNDDFSFLKKCPLLTSLNLSGCELISNFNFLENCSSLTNLDLSKCDINDTSFLEQCPTLTSLKLSESQEITSLNFLEKLPLLTSLDLSKCWNLEDLSPLKNCPLLTNLNFSECQSVQDCSFLRNCPSLINLDLSWCSSVRDIDFLEKCDKITSLNLLGCTKIQDFNPVKKCLSLTNLNLSRCTQVQTCDFLENCLSLTNLNLSRSHVNNFNFLKTCPSILAISLEWCPQIKDLDFLENCPSLKSLDLLGCDQINDFTGLEKCHLSSLNLTKTSVDNKLVERLRHQGINVIYRL